MNPEAQYPNTYCYFYVEGFACDPEEITRQLGITPTEFRRKGDAGRNGLPIKQSRWRVDDDSSRRDHFFESHLESLLPKIEPSAVAIRRLRDQCTVGVNCVGYFEGCNPGFEISATLLSRLAALNLTLGFDLYTFPETEEKT